MKLGFRFLDLESNGSLAVDISSGAKHILPADIPWSHGLLMSVIWSILITGTAYLLFRDKRSAGIVGLVVLSHWFLDFIVHQPELPLLLRGSHMVGLGLWTTKQGVTISYILEIFLLLIGVSIYLLHQKKVGNI